MRKVVHQNDPPALESLPAQEHLLRRVGAYYFRMRIPRELKRAGITFAVDGREQRHEIKFSLKTSNHKTASSLVPLHTAIWRAAFDEKLQEVEDRRQSAAARKLLFATGCKPRPRQASNGGASALLSDERIRAIVVRKFITLQRDSAKRIESLRGEVPELRSDAVSDIVTEAVAYESDSAEMEFRIQEGLQDHLRSYGLDGLSTDSEAFKRLFRGYRAALIEDAQRTASAIADGESVEHDAMFRGIHAETPLPDGAGGATLGELISDFERAQKAKRVSPKTHRANAPVFAALREHFTEAMPISKITQKEMTGFFDFLDSIPAHAPQRYKGKTLEEAALLESAKQPPRLLNHRTKANYHGRVVAIFQYALNMGTLTFNPANIPPLLDRFRVEKKSDRPPFTTAELSAIFKAPLYTGCESDERGWHKPGPNVFKRGRFWVPLLALFQAFRCNEACQLEIQDIIEEDGVPCIRITNESDDEENAKGKSVKNSRSKATVPMHPIMVRLGFLDFVQERRKAGDATNLFPELPKKSDGSYADIFSKWFNRFLAKTFEGETVKGTFHSFRHSFRDAARRARLHPEMADKLGRWSSPGSVGQHYGEGFGKAELCKELAKIEFPGVDFSHLLVYFESGCPMRRRRKPAQ